MGQASINSHLPHIRYLFFLHFDSALQGLVGVPQRHFIMNDLHFHFIYFFGTNHVLYFEQDQDLKYFLLNLEH